MTDTRQANISDLISFLEAGDFDIAMLRPERRRTLAAFAREHLTCLAAQPAPASGGEPGRRPHRWVPLSGAEGCTACGLIRGTDQEHDCPNFTDLRHPPASGTGSEDFERNLRMAVRSALAGLFDHAGQRAWLYAYEIAEWTDINYPHPDAARAPSDQGERKAQPPEHP